MKEEFIRISALVGQENFKRIQNSTVAVFGVGGVGSYAFEALVRSGVGTIHIFDSDIVAVSNLNRQIIALGSTVGQEKTAVAARRAADITAEVKVVEHDMFYSPETAHSIDLSQFDYIIDAIDTVTCKTELICRAKAAGVPIISVMGTANKLDPTKLCVTDIYKTSGCPLARVMRGTLRKKGIDSLQVVYSTEEPIIVQPFGEYRESGRPCPASAVFVPGAAGLIAAAQAVKNILNVK